VLFLQQDGSHGLDLSFVTHIFLLERIDDAALLDQIVARAHRLGALGSVVVETVHTFLDEKQGDAPLAGCAVSRGAAAAVASPEMEAAVALSSAAAAAAERVADRSDAVENGIDAAEAARPPIKKYYCDHCYLPCESKDDAAAHEAKCRKNPRRFEALGSNDVALWTLDAIYREIEPPAL
jgi:hypothetical protein